MIDSASRTSFVIRRATVDDAVALASLAEMTFRDAFAADNDPGDMDDYCKVAFGPALQGAQAIDPRLDTLVACDEQGRMVAYAQLRPGSPSEGEAPEPIELWRFYVDAAHHGRGLAHRLMDAALDAAAIRGAKTMWLGVWERNFRAQAFYRKFGFSEIGRHTFTLGRDRQTDLLMAMNLDVAPTASNGS
jgi:ribosomal protein S18 acetylase RimI-like enzyme